MRSQYTWMLLGCGVLLTALIVIWMSSRHQPDTIPEQMIQNGDIEAVAEFIRRGGDIARRSPRPGQIGRKALHYAAMYDQPAIIELLLDAGHPIDATDDHGHTPVHYAAAEGSSLSLDLLIRRGARIDSDGMTALHWAASLGNATTVG